MAQVFVDGEKQSGLKGETMSRDFQNLIEDYVQKRWSRKTA